MGLLSDLILNITDFREIRCPNRRHCFDHEGDSEWVLSYCRLHPSLGVFSHFCRGKNWFSLTREHHAPMGHRAGNLLCSKSSLKVIPYNQGNLWNNQTSLYTRSNPPIWATWRSKGFRIHPHLAEKMGTLLFSGTLGHTVGNQIHRVNVWTLGIPKMYMGTLGYKGQISL